MFIWFQRVRTSEIKEINVKSSIYFTFILFNVRRADGLGRAKWWHAVYYVIIIIVVVVVDVVY